MKNTKNQKNLIILLSLILIFTLLWVISNVYHSYVNSTIDLPLAEDIRPIEGTFDTNAIDELKTRKRVEATNDIITITEDLENEDETATATAQFEDDTDLDTSTESAEFEL